MYLTSYYFFNIQELFDGNAFCEIARLIDIETAGAGYIIGKKLQRHIIYKRLQHVVVDRRNDDGIGRFAD